MRDTGGRLIRHPSKLQSLAPRRCPSPIATILLHQSRAVSLFHRCNALLVPSTHNPPSANPECQLRPAGRGTDTVRTTPTLVRLYCAFLTVDFVYPSRECFRCTREVEVSGELPTRWYGRDYVRRRLQGVVRPHLSSVVRRWGIRYASAPCSGCTRARTVFCRLA